MNTPTPDLTPVVPKAVALKRAVREARELIESHGVRFRMRYLRYGKWPIPFPVDVMRGVSPIRPHGGVSLLEVYAPATGQSRGKRVALVVVPCHSDDLFCRAIAWQKSFQQLERSGTLAALFAMVNPPCGSNSETVQSVDESQDHESPKQ